MRAIWRKGWADLWGRRWQSLLIVVTVGAAAALLYLGLVALTTTTSPFDRLMEQTAGAHAYFLVDGPDRGVALAERLGQDPAVLAAELRLVYHTHLATGSPEGNPGLLVMPVAGERPALMGWVLVAGRNFDLSAPGEGVLSVSVARRFGVEPGDRVQVAAPSGMKEVTVVGFSADPMWCPYPTCSPQNLFVSPSTFADLTAGEPGTGGLLGARLSDPAAADGVVARVLKEPGTVRMDAAISWLSMRLGNQLLQGIGTLSMLIFALTAIAAAALITVNLIGGAVLAQFREIAVLKVLGFTARQVQLLFAGQNLLLGLAGSLAGTAAGHLVAARTMTAAAENLGNPDLLRFNPGAAVTVLVVVTAISCVVALLAAWPAVVASPAAALRNGFGTPRTGVPLAVRLLTALRVPVPVTLGVKDATARTGRAALTVLSLVLCIVTVGLSTGVGRLAGQFNADLDVIGMPYDLVAGSLEIPVEETDRIARQIDGVMLTASKLQVGVLAVDQEVAFRLEAVEGNWETLPWQVIRGRMMQEPGELMLATGIMRRLGAQVGDRIRLQVAGHEVEWTLVGEYRNPMELGMVGMVNMESIHQFKPEAKANQVMIRLERGADPAVVRDALLAETGPRLSVLLLRTMIAGGVLTDLLEQVRVLSILMAAIAALSMLNTALLTGREQVKEVGIRKALGMTPAQILAAVGAGGAWLGLIGAAIGVPLSVGITYGVFGTVTERLAYGQVTPDLTAAVLAMLAGGGVLLCTLAAMPAAVWAGRLVTAEALRAE